MPNYLAPEDDGLPMRDSGRWVVEKLHYLQRYISIFENSMHVQPWRRRHYIDLFSGPGKCYVTDTKSVYLGSPLIALTTTHPFTDYFFVDLDEDANNTEALQQRCDASPLKNNIQCNKGDANVLVHDIVAQILACDQEYKLGVWSSLNLAFLDPTGTDLQWETVKALAQPRRMDLIIYYPQQSLERNMPKQYKSPNTTKIDLFFGNTEWRGIFEKWQHKEIGLHRHLMDHYKDNLQKLDYKEVLRDDETGDEPLIRNSQKNAPLYRLLFASKHPLGNDFWHKVVSRNVYGQDRLL